MLKYFVSIFSIIIFYAPAFSQKTVFSYQPNPGPNPSYIYQSFIVPDKNTEKTAVILKTNNQAEYLLLKKDFSIEAKLQSTDGLTAALSKAKWFQYLAGVTNNLGTCFFYLLEDKAWSDGKFHLRMEVADFNNKTVTSRMLYIMAPGEKYIGGYTIERTFCLLTTNDKTSQLGFHIVDENGKLDNKYTPVDLESFNKDKLSLGEYLFNPHIFSAGDETELAAATDLTKIYVYPDKVVFVVANLHESPHIWTIDTRSYKIASKQKLDMTGFEGFNGQKEKFYNSSSLYGKNLYVLNVSKKKIEIGIYDFGSLKLLKKYDITESSVIPFVETPVEITTKAGRTTRNTISSNKELCKELFKGSTGIAVALNNLGQIILTCGVYDKATRSLSYYTGSFGPAPGAWHNGNAYTYTRTVNFKVILDPTELNIIKSNAKLSGFDKINASMETIDDHSSAENGFTLSSKNFVCYYLFNNKTFFIKEIER